MWVPPSAASRAGCFSRTYVDVCASCDVQQLADQPRAQGVMQQPYCFTNLSCTVPLLSAVAIQSAAEALAPEDMSGMHVTAQRAA
jgi:hypothetical protein